jgi:MFS transporter, NNP family, nitrate/nitrite transporter
MRAFHMTWLSFFVCFFGWFGVAPLMPMIREELGLSKEQVGNTLIASVAATILARLVVGSLCDRLGPRRVYAGLLALGAVPVMCLGLVRSYEQLLVCRLAVGAVGASFVITQYHTTAMFAPCVVGTANATTAGWGNLGGGVAQMVMPFAVALLASLGHAASAAWRLAMLLPGVLMLVMSIAYLKLTQDSPGGAHEAREKSGRGTFLKAARDARVWLLALAYGACFGVELTLHNVAATYFHDRFHLNAQQAGLVAGSFGVLAIFARALGGYLGDRAGRRFGSIGRARFLVLVLLAEGVGLLVFSRMGALVPAIVALLTFGLFVHMSAGATYAVCPFVRRDAVGAVSGIVGAGGNVGAVLAGLLFRDATLAPERAFLVLGLAVVGTAGLSLLLNLKEETGSDAVEPSVEAVPAR